MIHTSTCLYNDHDFTLPTELDGSGLCPRQRNITVPEAIPGFHHGQGVQVAMLLVVLLPWGLSLHLATAGIAV